jgi:hypothetical protein
VLVAEADIRPSEIQDLAEHVGAITKAAAGFDPKFRIRLEMGGPKKPGPDVVEAINGILREVSKHLKLQ